MNDPINDIKLDNDIKIQLSLDPHSIENLIFLKYFRENEKSIISLDDLDDKTRTKIIEELTSEYDLECVHEYESIGYDSYRVENGGGEIIDEDDLNFDYDGTYRIWVDRKSDVLIYAPRKYIKILSKEKISEEIFDRIKEILFKGFAEKTMSSVHVLAMSLDRGMYLSDFKIDNRYVDLDIDANYNDDFMPIYENIVDNLDKSQIGLYLLHGSHGTGKTTLIRHLIRKVNKRVIFISPSMASKFSDPDMIPFLMKYPDSIIIVEDSENIIKKREHGDDQSVSNLLNLSDGILGDCLRFQIICTFNTGKSEIDPALLRKGRLIDSYEFGKLDIDKTNALLNKLGYPNSDEPMRLSDIYNPSDNNFDSNPDRSIGFR